MPETQAIRLLQTQIAAKDARIAELERKLSDKDGRLRMVLACSKANERDLNALRAAIEAKAARFKQQAKDAKDAGNVAWAAMCLGASSDLLAILKKSGERADGVE